MKTLYLKTLLRCIYTYIYIYKKYCIVFRKELTKKIVITSFISKSKFIVREMMAKELICLKIISVCYKILNKPANETIYEQ